MTALAIGIVSGLLIIGFIALFKNLNNASVYALILTGIGFLYVGFTWTDLPTAIACGFQAVAFLFIAYFASQKSLFYLGGGYLLHGLWDLAYPRFASPELLPPDYHLFCMAADFVIGFYLIFLSQKKKSLLTL
jgi:hypothetical protein